VKALVTGLGGFVGSHLARHLLQADTTVTGTTFCPPDQYPHLAALIDAGVQAQHVELTDERAVHKLLDQTRPDFIYHLAAQSFVPESFDNPWQTLGNNIHAQLNILHSMVKLNLDARVLVIGSSEEYGPVSPDDIPVNEGQPLRPANPYSVSKVAQDMLGLQYHLSHNLAVIRVRPFNHIGPGQSSRFVAPAFASQIAAIEKGAQEPVLYVGSLEARRDFTDVRDMVRAYRDVLTLGEPGAVYNIGSGQARSVRELLDILLHMTDAPIEVQTDPTRIRPVEVPIVVCDASKLRATTGWQPAYTFEQTLADILEEWRARPTKPAR
jgi:GDP-4-dehydro-6-deoxy-D-mannose reductase